MPDIDPTAKRHIPHTGEAQSAVDHMIAIGDAGHNIKNNHLRIGEHSNLVITQTDMSDGAVRYHWSAGFADVYPVETVEQKA